MNRTSLRLALACVLLTVPALAAGPAPSAEGAGRRVTLDEALSSASRYNWDLKAARARFEQSAAGISQAWAALLPTVAAQGKYTRNYKEVTLDAASFGATGSVAAAQNVLITDTFIDVYSKLGQPPSAQVMADQKALADAVAASQSSVEPIVIQKGNQLDAAITANVPLLVPWAWLNLSAARKTAGAAESVFETTRAQMLLSVAQTFYAAADFDEQLVARRHGVEVTRKTLDDASARVAAGAANRVEVTRAQVAWERALLLLETTVANHANTYRALATLTGIEGPFVVEPGHAEAADRFGAQDDLNAMALKLRPEFAQYERQADAADTTARAQKWRWAPSLSAFGNLRVFNYGGFAGDNYAWAVGLTVDWVLYDGGLRGAQRQLALAQKSEYEAQLAALHRNVSDSIENARRNVSVQRLSLETAIRAVQLSKETLDLVRVQYAAGTATQLDLLNAQDQHINAELQIVQARFQVALADLQLQRQVGAFPSPPARDDATR